MIQYQFWLERLYVNKSVSFHVYDENENLLSVVGIRVGEEDPFTTDAVLYEMIKKEWEKRGEPVVFVEDDWIAYFAFKDEEGRLYIGGPIDMSQGKEDRNKLFSYRKKHGLTHNILNAPKLTMVETMNVLSMALGMITGKMVEEAELMKINGFLPGETEETEGNLANYIWELSEFGGRHVTYEYEKEYLNAIRNGDTEFLRKRSRIRYA